ncbi:hypothetical protein CY34DRAFT_19640 [Suillus luteus UH-Slu-Lm8-n1]|uniref:Uncharacterized protein n=1 Tax=Suillus luteus UH-Slu-Lm8-n1 TaxID=930992 RepID=A0A0C9ZQV8_9AGAM|nr:hypothetical protein CY34DRAFT_19640 [Suillus luteus UH-Slu-Lm8-n1]
MSRISTRDPRFLDRILTSDLSYHNERISKISKTAAIHAPGPAVVEIDYTRCIGVGSTEKFPVPGTCKCDKLMQQKWDTMVELARYSKTPGQRLLIRAFIPCGSAPKVKSRLISGKRIIPSYDSSQDHDPAEASDTFDHLYSCAISFTIVDHSYPVETLRLMNKDMDALTIEGKEDTTDPAQSAGGTLDTFTYTKSKLCRTSFYAASSMFNGCSSPSCSLSDAMGDMHEAEFSWTYGDASDVMLTGSFDHKWLPWLPKVRRRLSSYPGSGPALCICQKALLVL